MEWEVYSDAVAFAAEVEQLLYEREDEYSLFLGILEQIKAEQYEDYFLAIAFEEGEVAATCLMTPPHPLQLIVFKDVPEIEAEVAQRLMDSGIMVNAVIGDQETSRRFAEAWTGKTGGRYRVLMDQGLYRADAVNRKLEKSRGSWRVANKKDAQLLTQWVLLFEQETGIQASTPAEAAQKIGAFIEGKEIYVWEVDGQVVSCMKKSRPSKRGITVSFVFTPYEQRRKGYARTLVAEVTEELLQEFDFTMLYTDLKNPTSNKIYVEIGYEQIANPVYLAIDD